MIRLATAVLVIQFAVGCGRGPEDQEEVGVTAAADSVIPSWLKDVTGLAGIPGTLTGLVNTIIGWFGGGSSGPTNQQLSNQISALQSQVAGVQNGIDTLIHDNYNVTIMLGNLSQQAIEDAVNAEFANYLVPGFSNLAAYSSDLSQGLPRDVGAELIINQDSIAAATYFQQPSWYQVLVGPNSTAFTPLFALQPFLLSLQLRLAALPVVWPNGAWLTRSDIETEIQSYRDSLASLSPSVVTWAHQQCSVWSTISCAQWATECNSHGACTKTCIRNQYSYTATCPTGGSNTGVGFSSSGQAIAAGLQAIATNPNGYPAMEQALSVPQINQTRDELTTLLTMFHTTP